MGTIRAFKFYSARWGLDALYRRRLKVSTDDDINDPFEYLATGETRADRAKARRERSKIFSKEGIISFSNTWSEPLLWSHYADNHRGVVLGFDLKPETGNLVEYVCNRAQIPSGENNTYAISDNSKFWKDVRVKKWKSWRYEKEVRIFPSHSGSIYENGLYFRPFKDIGELKKVIIGDGYSSSGNKKLQDDLEKQGVSIITARLAFKSFSVISQDSWRLHKKL